jgi:hypothetical protein
MAKRKRYKIQCITEGGIFIHGWTTADEAPNLCPNNPAHTVNDNSTTVTEIQALDNLEATTDPTANDDIDDGYASGESRWFNNTSGDEFLCVDNSAGQAVWKCLTANTPNEVSATADHQIVADDFVLVNSMTNTPAAGTYVISFSASAEISNATYDAQYALFQGGTKIDRSVRHILGDSGPSVIDQDFAVHTHAVLTVNGSEAVEVKAHGGNTNTTLTIHERSLVLTKIS